MKTDRTNTTIKGRDEATPGKVGSVEMWFRGELIIDAAEGSESWSWRKVIEKRKREVHTRECTRIIFP